MVDLARTAVGCLESKGGTKLLILDKSILIVVVATLTDISKHTSTFPWIGSLSMGSLPMTEVSFHCDV